MIVYGDCSELVDTSARLAVLAAERARVRALPPGLDRHAALVGLFVGMAGVAQGVADALFAADGYDRRSAAQDHCMAILLALGRAVCRSWSGRFAAIDALPEILSAAPLPDRIEVRLPEGYAFYALYPEAYAEAARLINLPPPVRVIGLRSIGTGLAAIVAAVLGAPLPITVRPVGHPFARQVRLDPALVDELLGTPASYVIVDEGPGLSGSSFGAVADFLEDAGVPPERIAFLPGHAGDLGPQANQRHRTRWAAAQRPVTDLLPGQLTDWVEALVGPLAKPLQDISGGAWRTTRAVSWPPVNPIWERRKFLARTSGGAWLVKFAGIGGIGEHKLARARLLHAAGFVPEPRGLAHGFIVERWHHEARPLASGVRDTDLIAHIGRYLGFRARTFLAGQEGCGASLAALFDMARYNSEQILGTAAATALERWRSQLPSLSARVVAVAVDGRCAPHEWLCLPDGRYLKADALDHHAAHDLVGCQDVAWDVAGATVELGLSATERDLLAAHVGRAAGHPVDAELIAFYTPVYLAFRLGWHRMTADMLGGWPEEAARNSCAVEQLAVRLDQILTHDAAGRRTMFG